MTQDGKVYVVVERGCSERAIRVIAFERSDGLKVVLDIFEYEITEPSTCDYLGRNLEAIFADSYGADEVVIDPTHDDFDFGRVRKTGSKIAKLMKALM